MQPKNEDHLKELINERLRGTGYVLVCEYKVFRIRREISLQLTGSLQADTDGIESILSAIDVERAALDAFEKGSPMGTAIPPATAATVDRSYDAHHGLIVGESKNADGATYLGLDAKGNDLWDPPPEGDEGEEEEEEA